MINNVNEHHSDLDNVKITATKETMTMKQLFDQMDSKELEQYLEKIDEAEAKYLKRRPLKWLYVLFYGSIGFLLAYFFPQIINTIMGARYNRVKLE